MEKLRDLEIGDVLVVRYINNTEGRRFALKDAPVTRKANVCPGTWFRVESSSDKPQRAVHTDNGLVFESDLDNPVHLDWIAGGTRFHIIALPGEMIAPVPVAAVPAPCEQIKAGEEETG